MHQQSMVWAGQETHLNIVLSFQSLSFRLGSSELRKSTCRFRLSDTIIHAPGGSYNSLPSATARKITSFLVSFIAYYSQQQMDKEKQRKMHGNANVINHKILSPLKVPSLYSFWKISTSNLVHIFIQQSYSTSNAVLRYS